MHNNVIVEQWVDYVCREWLDRLNNGILPQFHPSVEPLIKKLRSRVSEKESVKAWHCIEQIQELYDHVPHEGKISPRMLLECGVAALRMGHAREAIPFLKGAGTSYSNRHDKAVSSWLLGCVYWYVGDTINALSYWEDGCHQFKEEELRIGKGEDLARWYKKIINEMEEAIKAASDNESPPSPHTTSTYSVSVSTVKSPENKNRSKRHVIRVMPILGRISAGPPSDIFADNPDYLNLDKINIGDKEYYAVSLLLGETVVNLPKRDRYHYLLRVSGYSMNKCKTEPIDDGDYVILRDQRSAENGDIVAALIVSGNAQDRQATLKRYVIRNNKVYLLPESDKPEFQTPIYQEQVFEGLDDEFQIRGVAIAVLKPL
jgi:SOS-response transcriptional repressor LexA